ncbi:hypothetical protein A9Q99_12690 [Gammaproteobacteria bacterium 45_16_T64]|nr:hypothetical protein A9Q99_12690 [Gammaproteobacteria bacterium 45_16_T64]
MRNTDGDVMNGKDSLVADEKELNKIKQGTYADILFIMLPFMAILLQTLWAGEAKSILLGPELSIAASILTGLSVSKFFQGLVADKSLGIYKERVVLIISTTLFLILIPSLILTMKLTTATEPPEIVAFVQPALLIVAMSLYISAISIIRAREDDDESESETTVKDDVEKGIFPVEMLKSKDEPETKEKIL